MKIPPAATSIPIAIVGLGFGRWIVKDLQQPKNRDLFHIAAVCDLDTARVEAIVRETGARVASFEELLADPAIPVIGLFTSPSGRADLVRRAFRAGKHVMTTKPFERDPAAALAVLREARELGLAVHLNSPPPDLPPDLVVIREWQETYQLGRPIAARASAWARYSETANGAWHDDPDLCPVAPIFRIGIYLINDLVEIFGEAAEVQVMSSLLFTGRPTPDNAQLAIRFQNGGLANVFASFCVGDGDNYRNSLEINFENGTVYRNAGAERRNGAAAQLSLVMRDEQRSIVVQTSATASMSGDYQWAEFYQAVSNSIAIPSGYPEKVTAALRIISAMSEAERTGRHAEVLS